MDVDVDVRTTEPEVELLSRFGRIFDPRVAVSGPPHGHFRETRVVESDRDVTGTLGPERNQGVAGGLESVPDVACPRVQMRHLLDEDPTQVVFDHGNLDRGEPRMVLPIERLVGEGVDPRKPIVGRVDERSVGGQFQLAVGRQSDQHGFERVAVAVGIIA